MPDIDIHTVPYHVGAERVGVGRGPDKLIEAGLVASLEGQGASVRLNEIGRADDAIGEIGKSFEAKRQVAMAVAGSVAAGRFPIVLAGNCHISVGVHAGLGDPDLGVVWFDAHPDFDTPDEHRSGYLDGMGVSTLAGQGWRNIAATIPGFRPMALDRLIYCGIRDFEPGQREKVEAAGEIGVVYGGEEQKGRYAGKLEGLLAARGYDRSLVHFDIDSLDTSEGIANQFAAPGGLMGDDALSCIDAVCAATRPAAMTIASFNPDLGGGDRLAEIGVEAARRVAAAVYG